MSYNSDDDEKGLLEEALEELDDAFNLYATVKHGVDDEGKEIHGILCLGDLASTMKELGFVLTEAEVFAIIEEVDQHKTGIINFEQFTDIVRKNSKIMNEDELLITFAVFDNDGNGHISSQEITHISRCLGMLYTEADIDDMMKEVDTDGDGRISYEDFVYFMTKY